MKLDHNSDKPLHIQAEEILRRLIESEEYKNVREQCSYVYTSLKI